MRRKQLGVLSKMTLTILFYFIYKTLTILFWQFGIALLENIQIIMLLPFPQHTCTRNWIVILYCKENKIYKFTKCCTRYIIHLSSIKPNIKRNCAEKRQKHSPH